MKTIRESSTGNHQAQRFAAVAILLVQAFALVLLMNSYVFPICVAILGCVGLFAPQRRWVLSLPGDRWVLFIGALFFLKFYFAPRQLPFDREFIFSSFAYEIASFCLVLELLFLYRKENIEKLPIGFLACAIIGFVFSGNIRLNHTQRLAMLVIVQLFLICWMIFSVKSRREVAPPRRVSNLWRNSIMLAVLLGAAAIGTTASVQLHRHERALEKMLSAYLEIGDRGPARSGFSNRGGLSDVSSWREFDGNTLALRIHSETIPGYMRGKVFDEFHMNRWTLTKPALKVVPTVQEIELQMLEEPLPETDHLYLIAQRLPEHFLEMKVWPVDNETAGHCFAPLDTVAMITRSRPIALDSSRIITRPAEQKVVSYSILVDPDTQFAKKNSLQAYLQLPELDDRVVDIAHEIYQDKLSPQEKMKATEQFFRRNFKYRKGIKIPRKEDRLGYFLENRVAAHCEYFASATTILLRLGGVPARYVTGFYVQEQNPLDKSWVARRKDAHAWVEAYDSQKNEWVIVESTPSDGLPPLTNVSQWEQRRELAAHFFRKIQENFARGNYTQAAWQLFQPVLWILIGVGVATGIVWLFRRKKPSIPDAGFTYQEFHQELVAEREELDATLGIFGFQRGDNETISQFAIRLNDHSNQQQEYLDSCANWYLDYANCRFRPGYSEQQLEELRSRRKKIQNQILRRPQGVISSD